jgi:hypothetical protein
VPDGYSIVEVIATQQRLTGVTKAGIRNIFKKNNYKPSCSAI